MRARKWLLTSVMCGGLLLAGGIGNRAAASGDVLQPNSDWAVSKLAAAQTGGQPYCALARRFDNNLILTMARNGNDETSIAIDFQKQALNNSQSYRVTLDPGFGQQRSFNVRPVSGKALVIRMGQAYAFHDALNRSGQLDVDVSGKSYAFNLSDYSTGQHKMGECLAGLPAMIEPAAGAAEAMTPAPAVSVHRSALIPASAATKAKAAPAVAPAPAPVRESASAPAVTSAPVPPAVSAPPPQDDAQLQALREENLRLRNALERERRVYEDRYMQEGQTSSLVAELSEKINILQRENEQLKSKVDYKPVEENCANAAPASLSPAALDPSIAKELSSLKDENLNLKEELAGVKAKNDALEKQVAAKPATDPKAAAVVDELRKRISALQDENSKLKATNASYAQGGADVPVSLAQLRSVEEQLRGVQADRDKLLAQIKAMDDAKGKGLLDISSSNWNLEQATKRYNEAEKEIRRLGREIEEQKMQCSTDKKELEYMLFDPSVATKEQIARLTKLENAVKQAKADIDDQKAAFNEKLSGLKSAAENAQTSLDTQRTEYEQKIAVLKKELDAREQDVAASTRQIAQLQGDLAAKTQSASEEAQSQIAALKQQLDKIKTDRDLMAAQKADTGQKLAALQEQMKTNQELADTARQRIAALQKELDQARVASAQDAGNPDLEARIASLEKENDDLGHQRDLLEQERNQLADQAQQLNKKIASLEDSLSSIQTASGTAPAGLPAPVAAEPIDAIQGSGRHGDDSQPQIYAYKDFGNSVDKTVSGAAPSAGLITASALETVLAHANIKPQGGIQTDSQDSKGFVAYSWNTGSLYGSAEQRIMSGAGQYDDMVKDYLAKTRARCDGDFAAVPAMSQQNGSMKVSSYEIACVGKQGGASASIVFYNDGNLFTAIAHETGVDNMATAMDARDSLVGSLLHTQVASAN